MNEDRELQNKRMHALVKPDECLGHWRDAVGEAWQPHPCFKCGENVGQHKHVPNYFSPELPDSIRVAMVTAARKKFGWTKLKAAVWEVTDYPNILELELELPAPAIAEAVSRLLKEENDGEH